MKKQKLFLLFLITVFIFTACSSGREASSDKFVYKMSTGEETYNVITVTNKNKDGFYLEADCCNKSLNLGRFEGQFEFITSKAATCTGKNQNGEEYQIIAEFKDDKLVISVNSKKPIQECLLLGFGMNVYLSGEYSLE